MTRARVTAIVLAAITVLQIRAALHSRCCVPVCGGDGVSGNGKVPSEPYHVLVLADDLSPTVECPNSGRYLPCGTWEVCGCDVPRDGEEDALVEAFEDRPCLRHDGTTHTYDPEFTGEMVVSGSTCWIANDTDLADAVPDLGPLPPGRYPVTWTTEDGQLLDLELVQPSGKARSGGQS